MYCLLLQISLVTHFENFLSNNLINFACGVSIPGNTFSPSAIKFESYRIFKRPIQISAKQTNSELSAHKNLLSSVLPKNMVSAMHPDYLESIFLNIGTHFKTTESVCNFQICIF